MDAASLPVTARLFLALWPGREALRQMLQVQTALAWPEGARLTRESNLHATLHFIGAVARARIPELAEGLRVAGHRFDLRLDRVEVWDRGNAVLTTTRMPAALLDLHRRLADALRGHSLPVDAREYKPHATLARHAKLQPVPPALDVPIRWRAQSYVLAESLHGAYLVLQRYPLD